MKPDKDLKALRAWKRSGSGTNLMNLQVAAENIQRNGLPLWIRNMSIEEIMEKLATGYRLETKHAIFTIYLGFVPQQADEPTLIG